LSKKKKFRMRAIFIVLSLLALTLQGKKIAVVIDVSGSATVSDAATFRSQLRAAVERYLFPTHGLVMDVFKFATQAEKILGPVPIDATEGKHQVTEAIGNLVFSSAHPDYYTNWEAGLQVASESTDVEEVYFITDGLPTTRTRNCVYPKDEPCDDIDANMRAAVDASLALQRSGKTVIPVGIGKAIDSGHLKAKTHTHFLIE
jgi:hypothetical protein